MSDETEQPTEGTPPPVGAPSSGSTPPPVPPPLAGGGHVPPVPPPPVARQLVRDPYTKLGGVASGLAHHYGIDVSLVRLAFVLFTLFSGIGLLVYILAWIIIPRAEYWPPTGGARAPGALSKRELAIGMVVLGAVVAIFFSGGPLAEVIVPLLLIGGGIWLLVQPNAAERPAFPAGAATPSPAAAGSPSEASPFAAAAAGQPVDTVAPPPVGVPVGSPVPPRRRRPLRALLIAFALFFGGLMLVAFLGIGALILFSDFDTNSGFSATYMPETVEELPRTIDHGQGEVVIDLTLLEPADFEDGPVSLDAELDFGQLTIIVPEDLVVDVDASARAGDVQVFENTNDGINPAVSVPRDEPHLRLDASLGFGELSVQRG